MATSFKIRLLLFILALSFAATALTLNLTFHKEDVLVADSKQIESNLHKKEQLVRVLLGDAKMFASLKGIPNNHELAEKLIPDLRDSHKIFLYTYRDNELQFWGSIRINPPTDAGLKEGSSFIKFKTGYFEAIKKSQGNFSAVCFIPIKSRYPYENEYLQNVFSPDLIATNHLEIAGLNDKAVYGIRNYEGKYLFSVKLNPVQSNKLYSKFELLAWMLAIFNSLLFINYFCAWLAEKGKIKTSVALFFLLFLLIRIITLKFNWLSTHFDLALFNSRHFVPNFFFPTLGDFLINTLCASWFLFFAFSHRRKIRLTDQPIGSTVSYMVFISLGVIAGLVALQLNDVFYGLVINSDINFDVTNIINLNSLSWAGILVLCISVLNLYLLIDILLAISIPLKLTNVQRLTTFLGGIIILLIIKVVTNQLNVLFMLFAAILFIRAWMVYIKKDAFDMGIVVTTVLLFAILCSLKLSEFKQQQELEQRIEISRTLSSSEDNQAVDDFVKTEGGILNDDDIINGFETPNASALLKTKLQKYYFEGYLSKYDFTVFQEKLNTDTANGYNKEAIENLKKLVVSGTTKVSKYFYHVTNTFGSKDYFGIFPVVKNGRVLGNLFIELKSKTFYNPLVSPKVLADGTKDYDENYKPYSFAFYQDGKLIGQYGKYVYSLTNKDFSGKLKKFSFKDKDAFNHLIYQPNNHLLIIVSIAETGIMLQIASISFLFLVLLVFAVICVTAIWLWKNISASSLVFRKFKWSTLVSTYSVLYKTRIQASMVAAVVTTLILVGFITYFSISQQYKAQQQQSLIDNINKITFGFEKKMFANGEPKINEQAFTAFADFNSVDLNYFDVDGKVLYSTQPKIYESELVAPRINALAYVYLNGFQQSEYLNPDEVIGQLNYIEAYKPIRNSNNQTVGYLGLPYFSYKTDFDERIGLFLNTLVNVYALVFVAIGFFAVFIANKITAPLTLVQKSLSQTTIGRKNEPIIWKRNDEIGSLVKEYNNMIEALDESTVRLASSERETAWKEMAKQVAHEIKNPLTPLKLGVQLLDKSWREKDPNFDKKFEKFSKSFIEQIESLSHIASEFSNFAKMPETTLEEVKLLGVVERSIEVYSKTENVSIQLVDRLMPETIIRGDKDQLLRCFNNLIKNAIESVPESRKGIIAITLKQDERHAIIEIEDNGKGIPEGLQNRIFNPNFTTKSSGTGLGLAFIKQAIGNMSGTINFTTEIDKGTTFYITLPLA